LSQSSVAQLSRRVDICHAQVHAVLFAHISLTSAFGDTGKVRKCSRLTLETSEPLPGALEALTDRAKAPVRCGFVSANLSLEARCADALAEPSTLSCNRCFRRRARAKARGREALAELVRIAVEFLSR